PFSPARLHSPPYSTLFPYTTLFRSVNAMGALAATPARIRHDLHTRLVDARARTDELFRIVREEALYDRPIAERHRIIFYVGHLEDRKSTRLNSSHVAISYAVCRLKK